MSTIETGRDIVQIFREEEVPFMGASIAYYAAASFVPLLLLALALVSLIGATEALIQALRAVLSESGSEVLGSILTDLGNHGVAGIIGLLLALWSGSKVFRGLSIAFDNIYTETSDLSLLDQLKQSVLAIGTLFIGFVLLTALSLALSFIEIPIPYPTLVGSVVAVVVLSLAFLPIYYIMPPVDVTIRHALPGAVVAATGWVLLQIGFYYYSSSAGKYAAYGLLGAILLFLAFLYLGAIILLIGAVVNVVRGRRPWRPRDDLAPRPHSNE